MLKHDEPRVDKVYCVCGIGDKGEEIIADFFDKSAAEQYIELVHNSGAWHTPPTLIIVENFIKSEVVRSQDV